MSASTDTAALLNEACRRVVAIARTGDSAAMAGLADRLTESAASASGADDPRHFLGSLARLLRDEPVEAIEAALPEVWRPALRAVAKDMAEPEDPARQEALLAWLADLCTQVSAVLLARDRAGALALDGALAQLLAQPSLDPDAAAFVVVLRNVLAGSDVRAAALALREPYAQAYRAFEARMRGAGPSGARAG